MPIITHSAVVEKQRVIFVNKINIRNMGQELPIEKI